MRKAMRMPAVNTAMGDAGKPVIPAEEGIHPTGNPEPPTTPLGHPEPARYWQGSP